MLYKNEPGQVHFVLKSLAESKVDVQVYIIDNSPQPVDLDPGFLPSAHYIKTKKNIGFGAAHNLAIEKSLDSGTKYHLVLNPDVYFSPGVIEELHEYMEAHPDVGNIMPLVCYPDGNNQYLAKLLPTPGHLAIRLFHRFIPASLVAKVNRKYELQDLSLDRPVQVAALSGCFMFLRCRALREAGLFDERFFLYFEDFDLIRRINSRYKVIYYPKVSIKHHFERASRKNLHAFLCHLASGVKYFNKWGWRRDEQRKLINQKVLKDITRSRIEAVQDWKARLKAKVHRNNIGSMAIISNQAFAMINFRGSLIRDLVQRGIRVYALTPNYSQEFREKIKRLGAEPVDYPLDRAGINPFVDIIDMVRLTEILARLKPDAVLCNFIKPVIYGSWAAKKAGVPNIFSMISGLGYMFTDSPGNDFLKKPFFKKIVCTMYKSALSSNQKVFFHNPDDLAGFVNQDIVDLDKSVRTFGSGVDLNYFRMAPVVNHNEVVFLLAARLLVEKGIKEYAQAAAIIRKKYPDARFLLLGGTDINPAGLQEEEVQNWVKKGLIEWPGQVDDVRPWLKKCSVYVLPSWREGTPRSTLEAMAAGRPIITTDVPGCRETILVDPQDKRVPVQGRNEIIFGKNGLMVPVRDPKSLARAMEYLIKNREIIPEMGRQSRLMAEDFYDVKKVNAVILREMGI